MTHSAPFFGCFLAAFDVGFGTSVGGRGDCNPGKFGELPGKPGDFAEARGSLTPSQRLTNWSPNLRFPACCAFRMLFSFFFLSLGDLKITSTSTEKQKRSQNLAPVLVIISGKSLVFSRNIITSTDFAGSAPRRVSTSSGNKSVSHFSSLIFLFLVF